LKNQQEFKLKNLIDKLLKNDLHYSRFFDFLQLIDIQKSGNNDVDFELLIANGLPLEKVNNYIRLQTKYRHFKNQEFVFVDIETNGSNGKKDNIIEIGAIKIKNTKIIDKCHSLIWDTNISPYVTKVTGITQELLQDAPKQIDVIKKFKIFLKDAVFVAHNVKFDYNYISDVMHRYNIGRLYNRKLCTIDLAKKTIQSQRYGLEFLNEYLGLNNKELHRAYNDAYTSYEIFLQSLKNIPPHIKTVENLIRFSTDGI